MATLARFSAYNTISLNFVYNWVMAEIYLASSALANEEFDGLRTIEEAARAGFAGVQLFLDPRYRRDGYLAQVVRELAYSHLGLVVHLPNTIVSEDIAPVEKLAKQFPASRSLIHYLPTTILPRIGKAMIGWENSVIGWDVQHIQDTKEKVRKDKTFFVFDLGRPLVLEGKIDPDTAIEMVRAEIAGLRPGADVIHAADKTEWDSRFRGHWCAMGRGICQALLGDLRAFQGVVVLEHENLQMAVESLDVLK